MERKFIIGPNLEEALNKYPIDSTVYEVENPLQIDSAQLELKFIFGILANSSKNKRELTITEQKNLKWIQRMYPDFLKFRHFSIAIKFQESEKQELIQYIEEYKNKKVNLSNIYRVFCFSI